MFLKKSQISQKNTCIRVNCIKKRLQHRCFPVKFLRTPFLQNTPGDCFWTWTLNGNMLYSWIIWFRSNLWTKLIIFELIFRVLMSQRDMSQICRKKRCFLDIYSFLMKNSFLWRSSGAKFELRVTIIFSFILEVIVSTARFPLNI